DREAIREGRGQRHVSSEVSWSGSRSGSPWYIEVDEERIRQKEQDIRTIDQLLPLYTQLPDVISFTEIRNYALGILALVGYFGYQLIELKRLGKGLKA